MFAEDSPPPGRRTIAITVAVLCIIWSTTWSVIAVGLKGIPPFSGVAIRFTIAGLILLLVAKLARVQMGRQRRELGLWLINGVLAFSISYGVVYWAEQWVPSGLAAVLFATYPLFVAILAHFLLPDESLRGREIVGAVVGFAGVGVIFSANFDALGGPQVAVASGVILLSPASAALGSVLIKKWGKGVHTLSLNAIPMLITGALVGVVAVILERDAKFLFDATSLGALFYLAIAGTAVTFTLYYWLLGHLPAKRLSLIAYVIPVLATLIGIALGEPLTVQTIAGSACVVLGVALAIHR